MSEQSERRVSGIHASIEVKPEASPISPPA
jgi:hypothetical protein